MSDPTKKSLERAREFHERFPELFRWLHADVEPCWVCRELAALLDKREATVRQEQHDLTSAAMIAVPQRTDQSKLNREIMRRIAMRPPPTGETE